MLVYIAIGAFVILLSIIFRVAAVFRLSVPLLYALIAPTLFFDWFQANYELASLIGYLLVLGAVFSWNAYNFITAGLSRKYRPLDLTLYQTICTALLALPFLLHDLPPASAFAGITLPVVLYLGCVSEGLGIMLYVNAINKLGPTPCALFSNMLPVSTVIFGWLILGEQIFPVQMVGGVIVVVAGILVIREKGRLDEKRQYDAGVSR